MTWHQHRYVEELTGAVKERLSLAYSAKDLLAFGLRSRLREGYRASDFRADAMAALVVGVVALPLSMALAIASDVPPQHGLYTAIVAGLVCSLLGGTYYQVTGPTAAFVVILLPIVHEFGLGGLLVAGMLAGVILICMGLARLGHLMEYIPHPVTSGFTMGIAVVLGLLQVKDVVGVKVPQTESVFEYLAALFELRHTFQYWDLGIAGATLAALLWLPRVFKRTPVPLIALVGAGVLVVIGDHVFPSDWGFRATTVGSKFSYLTLQGEVGHGIPQLPPLPVLPWQVSTPGDPPFHITFQVVHQLLPSAFAIAMLGAIESLMAAVVADGMSGSRHDPNAELIALGIGNLLCPFFGGIAATGALARTATNIRAGARSPLAAAMHALFILACTVALAPLVSYLPMAALAALLMIVARNMSEVHHFVRLTRVAPRHDVVVMMTCFGLTVLFDMVIAVTAGVLLAALLFIRRMAVLTKAELTTPERLSVNVPPGVRVYQIAGPLFFGAAKSAMEALHTVGDQDHTYILDMRLVPTMDATGLVALESVLARLASSKIRVIFSGLSPEVDGLFERFGIRRQSGKLVFAPDMDTAVSIAARIGDSGEQTAAGTSGAV